MISFNDDVVFKELREQSIIQVTYILVAIHASQVKRSVPIVVLSICVRFIVQQQQLREQKRQVVKKLQHQNNYNTLNITAFNASQFQRE